MPLESPTIDVAVNTDKTVTLATTTSPDTAPERTTDSFYCKAEILRRDTADTVLSLLPPSGSNISKTGGMDSTDRRPAVWPDSYAEGMSYEYAATATYTTPRLSDGDYTALHTCWRTEPYDNSTGPGDTYISYSTTEFGVPASRTPANGGDDAGGPFGSLGSLGSVF